MIAFRECADSEIMKKYGSFDIVMSDEDNNCYGLQ